MGSRAIALRCGKGGERSLGEFRASLFSSRAIAENLGPSRQHVPTIGELGLQIWVAIVYGGPVLAVIYG